jgi:hypothetical protein
MEHEKPIHAAWHLYEHVEPTARWAEVLQHMFRLPFRLDLPKTYLPDLSTDEGREEWRKTSSQRYRQYEGDLAKTVQEKWRTPEGTEDEHLTGFFWARVAFAQAASRAHVEVARSFPGHPDQAFRVGWYAGATFHYPGWPVDDFNARDGWEFISAILRNPIFYERLNYRLQRAVYQFACDHNRRDDYQSWFKSSLKNWIAKDPQKYGDEPTPAMEAEKRRYEEEKAQQEARKQLTEGTDTRSRIASAIQSQRSLGMRGDSWDNYAVARETLQDELDNRQPSSYDLKDATRDILITHARQDAAHALGNTTSILKRMRTLTGLVYVLLIGVIAFGVVLYLYASQKLPGH